MPNCSWHYLVEESSADILRGHVPSERLITFPKDGSPWKNPQVYERCKGLKFDAALCTSGIGYWNELLFALRLQIPNRCAFVHKGFSGFVTHPSDSSFLPAPVPVHFRSQVAEITGLAPSWDIRPNVFSSREDIDAAQAILIKHGLTSKNSYAISITTRQNSAVWPHENFAALIRELKNRHDLTAVLLGSTADSETLRSFSERYRLDAVVLPGSLALNSLVPFLRGVGFTVCPDSGVRHLSNAAGIPVFFFRNLACFERETGAYLDTEFDLTPTGSYLSPQKQLSVLKSLTPSAIANSIARQMQLAPRSEAPVDTEEAS